MEPESLAGPGIIPTRPDPSLLGGLLHGLGSSLPSSLLETLAPPLTQAPGLGALLSPGAATGQPLIAPSTLMRPGTEGAVGLVSQMQRDRAQMAVQQQGLDLQRQGLGLQAARLHEEQRRAQATEAREAKKPLIQIAQQWMQDPDADVVRRGQAAWEEATGLKIPRAIREGRLGKDQREELAAMVTTAQQSPDAAERRGWLARSKDYFVRHGGLESEWSGTLAQINHPDAAAFWGRPDPVARRIQHLTLEEKAISVWSSRHPEWADKGELRALASWGNEYAGKQRPGTSIYQLDSADPREAAILSQALAYAETKARMENRSKEEREIAVARRKAADVAALTTSRMIEVERERMAHKPDKPLLTVWQQRKVLGDLERNETGLAEIAAINQAYENLAKKGITPWATGPLAGAYSQVQMFLNQNDPDLLVYQKNTLPVIIGIVDRTLNDEKGSRAWQQFQEQSKVVQQLPTPEGYRRLFGLWGQLIVQNAERKMGLILRNPDRYPSEFIEEIQDRLGSLRTALPPSLRKAAPTTPSLPPGVTR